MTFPPDPNAPGGPQRSQYLREHFAPPGAPVTDPPPEPDITIRVSTVDDNDRESLRRLASLDYSPAPSGPVVFAELNGNPVAALSIRDGHTVADPSRSVADALAAARRPEAGRE